MHAAEDVEAAAVAFAQEHHSEVFDEGKEAPGTIQVATSDETSSSAIVEHKAQWASGKYAASWWRQFMTLLWRSLLNQLRNPTDTSSRLLMSTWVGTLAGLVFYNLPEGPNSTQERLADMFFILLLYQLLPFCFTSFYSADRRHYALDVAANLYSPSAYYFAMSLSSAHSLSRATKFRICQFKLLMAWDMDGTSLALEAATERPIDR